MKNNKLELLKQLEQALTPELPDYTFEKEKLLKEVPDSLLELFEENEESFFIAGGAITSIFTKQPINDIDIYPKTTYAKLKLIDWMKSNTGIQTITEKSIYGITNGDFHINLVLLNSSNTPEDIFNKFDFVINMGAFDVDTETFSFHKGFFRDLASRYIRVNENTLYPLVSVLRVDKYKERGYSIGKNELAKLLLKVSTLKIESIKDIENHLGGMYGIDFDNLLDENEEFSIDAVCGKLSKISVDYAEYYKSKREKFDNQLNKLIVNQINTLIKENFFGNIFIHGKTLFQKNDNNYTIFDFNFSIPDNVDFTKIPEDASIYLYKNVMKKDDRYYSFFDKSFEYIIGEKIKPKGSSHLHFYAFNNRKNSTYFKEKNNYILKAEIKIKDIHSFGSTILVDKCIPIEAKKGEIIEKCENIDFPF